MPTYEYACTDCGDRLEAVQKFSDDPLTLCSACGGKLRKVFSPVGIVFKGSGFYRTDSRADHKSSETVSTAKSNGSGDSKKSETGAGSSSSSSDSSSSSSSSADKASGEKKPGEKVGSSSSSPSSSGSKVA